MAIKTFQKKSEDNRQQATALLEEGDRHLHTGAQTKALDCYMQAADMVPSLPADYCRKAAALALSHDNALLGIEGRRIAACFELMAHDEERGDDDSFLKVMQAFEAVLTLWRSHNMAPLQHLILSGEGYKRYMLELVWNEAGALQDTDTESRVKEYLQQKPVYVVTLDSLYGWRPFEMLPMLSTDEDIQNAFPYFARGGISYMSPRIRPMIVERFQRKGRGTDELPEYPFIPASMNWYENYGYLDGGFGTLEGL